MQKLLVTGGAGFLGSHMVAQAVAAGYQVTVVDAEVKAKRYFYVDGVEYVKAMVNDAGVLTRVAAGEFAAIAHLAAQTSVVKSVEDPAYDAEHNIVQPLALLEAALTGGVRAFVFSSTGGAIYGNTTEVPTPHREDAQPLSPYGISKLALERYLGAAAKRSELRAVSLRFANIYGPHQVLEQPMGDGGVVPIFLDRVLRTGEPVTIFGDGEQTRDFVYVADAARAVILGLSAKVSGSWNIGTGEERTVNQLWADVQRLHGAQHPTLHAPERVGEVRRSALDAALAARDLGWKPQVTWEKGLKETYSWYAGNSER